MKEKDPIVSNNPEEVKDKAAKSELFKELGIPEKEIAEALTEYDLSMLKRIANEEMIQGNIDAYEAVTASSDSPNQKLITEAILEESRKVLERLSNRIAEQFVNNQNDPRRPYSHGGNNN